MVDSTRREFLKTGAAAAAIAATPSVLARQGGNEAGGRFYQRGNVRIHYEETGSGFPLLLISGGGLNGSTIAGIRGGSPFNTIEAFGGSSVVSTLTYATRPGSPPALSRSTGPGIPTPTIISG
jgi:hypothetical protein